MIGSPRGQFTHDFRSDNRFLINQDLHEKAGINTIYLHLFLPKGVNIKAKRHGILALSNFTAGSLIKEVTSAYVYQLYFWKA